MESNPPIYLIPNMQIRGKNQVRKVIHCKINGFVKCIPRRIEVFMSFGVKNDRNNGENGGGEAGVGREFCNVKLHYGQFV